MVLDRLLAAIEIISSSEIAPHRSAAFRGGHIHGINFLADVAHKVTQRPVALVQGAAGKLLGAMRTVTELPLSLVHRTVTPSPTALGKHPFFGPRPSEGGHLVLPKQFSGFDLWGGGNPFVQNLADSVDGNDDLDDLDGDDDNIWTNEVFDDKKGNVGDAGDGAVGGGGAGGDSTAVPNIVNTTPFAQKPSVVDRDDRKRPSSRKISRRVQEQHQQQSHTQPLHRATTLHTAALRQWLTTALQHTEPHTVSGRETLRNISMWMGRQKDVEQDNILFARRFEEECKRGYVHAHTLKGRLEVDNYLCLYVKCRRK